MTCPHCQQVLSSVIKYFSEHQALQLDERGKIIEAGPVHRDGVEDVACGHCLKTLTDEKNDHELAQVLHEIMREGYEVIAPGGSVK